jgi:hypothetical protein
VELTTDVIDDKGLALRLLILGGRVALVVATLGPTSILTRNGFVRLAAKVRREGDRGNIESVQALNRENAR